MKSDEYIKERIDKQIRWYSDKAAKLRSSYRIWQILKLFCALLIPIATIFMDHLAVDIDSEVDVLTATNLIKNEVFKWSVIIAILGGLILLIEGLQKLYNFMEMWHKYRTTAEVLRAEKILFQTETGEYQNSNEPYKTLVKRCENIMREEHQEWKGLVSDTTE
jgi:hypothetical protein